MEYDVGNTHRYFNPHSAFYIPQLIVWGLGGEKRWGWIREESATFSLLTVAIDGLA